MVENVVGVYGLPLGIALNFRVNGSDYLVPMCVEEPSVIAAASNAAQMIREGGGFVAEADDPIMISQVQLDGGARHARRDAAHRRPRRRDHPPGRRRLSVAGGARRRRRGIEVRTLKRSTAHEPGHAGRAPLRRLRDAMGANLVNTIAEAVADAPRRARRRRRRAAHPVEPLRPALRARHAAACRRAASRTDGHSGEEVRDGIVAASRFAELDPYRAATHNKGIMNGVDAVVIATGNDWRGVEAGAHAFAADGRNGGYGPLATWRVADDGRAIWSAASSCRWRSAPSAARCACTPARAWRSRSSASSAPASSACVMASAGLASNLAALRALATEGIQRGHMALHARSLALHVGATGELVDRVAEEMSRLGDVRAEVRAANSANACVAPTATRSHKGARS